MVRKTLLLSLAASGALIAAAAGPAQAGEKERAREAIAAADARIQTAERLGAGVEMPAETSRARAALAFAREDLTKGHNGQAIEDAIHASSLADTAVAELQRRREAALAQAQDSARASAEAERAAHENALA